MKSLGLIILFFVLFGCGTRIHDHVYRKNRNKSISKVDQLANTAALKGDTIVYFKYYGGWGVSQSIVSSWNANPLRTEFSLSKWGKLRKETVQAENCKKQLKSALTELNILNKQIELPKENEDILIKDGGTPHLIFMYKTDTLYQSLLSANQRRYGDSTNPHLILLEIWNEHCKNEYD